ncbi:MAG: hypothetical protein CMJ89_15720 [Planctomycetes bacterium]|nr:hypothetical protein [Planctomycetota bacterium]
MAQDFFSFDEALGELNLREEELKRLVSEGEIRAFREGETMKLRRTDVESLKSELIGGEVVDVGSAGDELVFEDDLELEETGMATEEISDMDTLLEEDVEDVGEVELDEEIVEDVPSVATPAAHSGETHITPVGARAVAPVEVTVEPLFARAVAILTCAVLVLGIPITMAVTEGNPGVIAQAIADWFPN